ncbi:unnamed protein product, partial [marine sediment metagenome]
MGTGALAMIELVKPFREDYKLSLIFGEQFGGRKHTGLDWMTPKGTVITPAAPGHVIKVGFDKPEYDASGNLISGGYGHYV